jgi:mitochondrial fission protein ELM1
VSGSDYSDKAATPAKSVRVWAIASYRAGENSQIFGLVSRLPLESTVKRIAYRPLAGPFGLLRAVTDLGIDHRSSDALVPPWPDLVVTAGVKNEPICRWIKRQSGGRTRLVLLGRTWANRRHFDLVVTTPQYRLPVEGRVQHNLMTQHGITPERLRVAATAWRERYRALPAPRVGVLLGGDSGPFVFGPLAARRLADDLNSLVGAGGSLMITSSARTPPAAVDALVSALEVPHDCHRWRQGEGDNPYMGILGLADEIVVTADSIAMLSEAAATGKPVHMFRLRPAGQPDADANAKARAYALLMKYGPQRLSRDLSLFHDGFIAAGHGVWLGETGGKPPGDALREADATCARLLALL